MEPGGHTTAEDSPRSLYETTGQSKLCLRCILVCQINCTNLAYIYIYIYICMYSQVHKYWDIDTILTFLALYTTTMISNETNKMCFNCRLSALI